MLFSMCFWFHVYFKCVHTFSLAHSHVVFAYFGDVGAICSHFFVGRSDRSYSVFGFVGIIAQFVFGLSGSNKCHSTKYSRL